MCGEFPADQLNRLIPSASYAEKLITDLKAEHLIRTHYRDALRGYRLTKAAKEMLLSVSPLRFQCYLTGNTDGTSFAVITEDVRFYIRIKGNPGMKECQIRFGFLM